MKLIKYLNLPTHTWVYEKHKPSLIVPVQLSIFPSTVHYNSPQFLALVAQNISLQT